MTLFEVVVFFVLVEVVFVLSDFVFVVVGTCGVDGLAWHGHLDVHHGVADVELDLAGVDVDVACDGCAVARLGGVDGGGG